jgi:hypothetical protein
MWQPPHFQRRVFAERHRKLRRDPAAPAAAGVEELENRRPNVSGTLSKFLFDFNGA